MTNCIIIHGCPSNKERALDPERRSYDKHWIPWTKRELIKRGIPTEAPLMPDPWDPVYEKFTAELEKQTINEETVLIGHSCGCAFLVRWLGDTKRKIGKLILVAPWKIPYGDELKVKFYTYEIDKTVKDRVDEIAIFTSNDEDPDGIKSAEIFHKAIGGRIIKLKDHGHYCLGDMGTEEFPELIEFVLS